MVGMSSGQPGLEAMMPDSPQELALYQAIAAAYDNPNRYNAVGHDGISEQCLLPGSVLYEVIADDPERFEAYCDRRKALWRRPTTTTREKPRKFTATT